MYTRARVGDTSTLIIIINTNTDYAFNAREQSEHMQAIAGQGIVIS